MAARAAGANAPIPAAGVLTNLFNLQGNDNGVLPIIDHPISTNLDDLIAHWGVTMDTTGVVKSAMIVTLCRVDLPDVPRTGAANANVTKITTNAVVNAAGVNVPAVVGSSAAVDQIEANAAGNFLRQVITALPASAFWIQDLVASNQVKVLSASNIQNYFLAKDNTRVVGRDLMDVIALASSSLPKLMNDEGSRARLTHNMPDWLRYHTTATGTAGLVHKFKAAIAVQFPTFISRATQDAIDLAYASPWNKALADLIPRTVVAASYIWFKETKSLPEDWYQGKRAFSEMNPVQAKAMANLFRKYLDLATSEAAVNACQNMGALVAFQSGVGGIRDL